MEQPRKKKQGYTRLQALGDAFWNLLTLVIIIGCISMVVVFYLVYQNPRMGLNPYPPPTEVPKVVLPSSTPTLPQLPPTWTPEITDTAVPTFTPRPSSTPPQPTLPGSNPAATFTPTEKPASAYSFALQSEPTGIDAAVLYPERACNWMGVGGQVVDLQGRPVTGITVQVGGNLGSEVIDQTSLTGLALKYGDAGYEFELAKLPIASKGTLWVRLVDQARLPLSAKYYFDTYEDCQRNLIILNFRQVK